MHYPGLVTHYGGHQEVLELDCEISQLQPTTGIDIILYIF